MRLSQKPISLFDGVEILPNISQRIAIQYLQRYCTVDILGDTIYPKKPGNNSTTYAITFECDEIILVKKIKESAGNNTDEILFDRADMRITQKKKIYMTMIFQI